MFYLEQFVKTDRLNVNSINPQSKRSKGGELGLALDDFMESEYVRTTAIGAIYTNEEEIQAALKVDNLIGAIDIKEWYCIKGVPEMYVKHPLWPEVKMAAQAALELMRNNDRLI